ncbi:hypothetical protein O6P43_005814 [Quillaja saponaria]|uniref:Uncharacterized protein n=1 Tax=Quillaja saponaria TaxID=32244 RepID=A0AAD7Q6W5_QUISA|nr:hypothetical protein O6P43_005814 [Quillaja saponaria]
MEASQKTITSPHYSARQAMLQDSTLNVIAKQQKKSNENHNSKSESNPFPLGSYDLNQPVHDPHSVFLPFPPAEAQPEGHFCSCGAYHYQGSSSVLVQPEEKITDDDPTKDFLQEWSFFSGTELGLGNYSERALEESAKNDHIKRKEELDMELRLWFK